MNLTVYMNLPNFANVRMHYRQKAEVLAEQSDTLGRALIGADWSQLPKPTADDPWRVLLVRLSPKELDDDGVVSSLKRVRDVIAGFVGVNDKDRHIIRYAYDQERSSKVGVRIEITRRQLELKGES